MLLDVNPVLMAFSHTMKPVGTLDEVIGVREFD